MGSETPDIEEKATTQKGEEEAQKLEEQFESVLSDTKQPEITRELLRRGAFPTEKTVVQGRTFFMGPVVRCQGMRFYCIMYTEVEGCMVPRLLFKSNSGAEWRVTEGGVLLENGDRIIGKGNGIHYTQEIGVAESLAVYARRQEQSADIPFWPRFELDEQMDTQVLKEQGIYTYDREGVHEYVSSDPTVQAVLDRMKTYRPGSQKDPASVSEMTAAYRDFPKSFVPQDFEYPMRTETGVSHRLGNVTFDFFRGDLDSRPVIWKMARAVNPESPPNRVVRTPLEIRFWCDAVYFQDSPISSYGNRTEVIPTGFLTSKSIEYDEQTEFLPDEARGNAGYSTDISLVTLSLPPVRAYAEACLERVQFSGTARALIERQLRESGALVARSRLNDRLKNAGSLGADRAKQLQRATEAGVQTPDADLNAGNADPDVKRGGSGRKG